MHKTFRETMQDIFWTIVFSLLAVSFITVLYVIARWIHTPLSTSGTTADYITAVLFICVAGGFFSSMVMFIWIGVREKPGGLLKTPFYIPQLLGHIFFSAITIPGGIASVDRIYHHDHPQWRFFQDAEVSILIRFFYLCVLIVSFQFTGTWVATGNEDKRKSWRRLIVGFVIFMILLIIGSCALYWLGGQ